MRKILGLIVFSILGAMTAGAQSLKESEVPSAVKTAFHKQYPGVASKWEKEKDNYEVNFKEDGKTKSVVITKVGKIIETETDIAISELPQIVHSYIAQHYKGAKVKEAAKVINEKGELNYEAEVNGKDIMFDANGKFLKEAKD